MYTDNITIMPIYSDDKEVFQKCREIRNKMNELIGINNATDFVQTTLDDGDEFIMVKVHRNASPITDNHKYRLVFVLHAVFNDYHQTSLVQYRC